MSIGKAGKKLLDCPPIWVMVCFSAICIFSGCSKKEDAAAPQVQGISATSIKVGNSIATSGPLAVVGLPCKAGIEAYFKMINDGGGMKGRKIEYIHEDDEFMPAKGKAAIDRLIKGEKIYAIVGHFGTPVVGATLADIKAAGIPAVHFVTGIGMLYNEHASGNERCIFPVQPVYPMEGRVIVTWAIGEFKAKKLGVIYTNDDAGKDLLRGAELQVSEIGGVELVSVQVPPGTDDTSAAVTKIKNENVDIVFIAAIQGTFPQIVKEMAKQGVYKTSLTTYVNADQAMTAAVKEARKNLFDIYATSWVDMTRPEIATYCKWIAQTSNEDLSNNMYAMTGWIAAYFFCQGFERLGDDLSWEAYINAMEKSPILNPFGGFIDYRNGKRLGTQEMGLLRMTPNVPAGWESFRGFSNISDILAGKVK